MTLPPFHAQRGELQDEVHARPPVTLMAPVRISYLALVADAEQQARQWMHLAKLFAEHGRVLGDLPQGHLQADLGDFRIKYERHTEFYQLSVIAPASAGPFEEPAIALVPTEWIAALPGQVIVGVHVAFVAGATGTVSPAASSGLFGGNDVVGSKVSEGVAEAVTDFRTHADGFGRILVLDHRATQRQAGRIVQRLLEIETYRMMALLALPVARKLGPELAGVERELSSIARAMTREARQDEANLLDRLMTLEAAIESRYAETQFRFNAAAAYDALVQRRIVELREERIEGLQTIREFVDRRVAPAMATCVATARRMDALSERVSRATQLLSTRVAVARETHNQDLLAAMARRAKLQLRLQQTVEGLSAAAITYYVVGLVGYAAKGLQAISLPVRPDLVTALSIPVVLGIVVVGVRRLRRMIGLGGAHE